MLRGKRKPVLKEKRKNAKIFPPFLFSGEHLGKTKNHKIAQDGHEKKMEVGKGEDAFDTTGYGEVGDRSEIKSEVENILTSDCFFGFFLEEGKQYVCIHNQFHLHKTHLL